MQYKISQMQNPCLTIFFCFVKICKDGAKFARRLNKHLKVVRKKQGKDKSPYIIPNLRRAFEILDRIAKGANGVSYMELLAEFKCSKTTLFRILATLEDSGYVSTSQEGGFYFLSRKIINLAHAAIGECNIPAESVDLMRTLRDELGETVMLGALHNGECVMLEQEVSLHDFNFCGKLGMCSPLHASAPGKCLLAFLPATAYERELANLSFKKITPNTITNRKALEDELKLIRQRGYSTDDCEAVEALRCVAAPIFDNKNYPAAVLWITGPVARVRVEDFSAIAKKVVAVANSISVRLGK